MAAPPAWRSPDLPIRVGISSCLLGEEVRYDGGHQKDAYITGVLARHFTWVPVCPEMEVGMGVPREPIRLVGDAAAPRLLGDHERDRPHGAHERVRAAAGGRAAAPRAERLHPEARVALLRPRAREGLSGRGAGRAHRHRALRARAHRRAAAPAGGGGGPAQRRAPARQLHHPRLRLPPPRRAAGIRAAPGRGGRVPHRAQVPAARAQPRRLRAPRSPGRGGRPPSTRAMARRLWRGLHGGARGAGNDQEARQRPPAHHGVLQDAARGRGEARAARNHRRLRGRASCPWWCRSR